MVKPLPMQMRGPPPNGNFLGYSFGAQHYKANGRWYLSASPSKKSIQRLKTKVGNLLAPDNNDPWPDVRDALNGFSGQLVALRLLWDASGGIPGHRLLRL
jgi:hypothetical protein